MAKKNKPKTIKVKDSSGKTRTVREGSKAHYKYVPDYKPSGGGGDDGPDFSGLYDAADNEVSSINKRQKFYRSLSDQDTAAIRSEYGDSAAALAEKQRQEFAGRSTGLILQGGYLGATQSHEGALSSLNREHESEQQALYAKRDAAIRASRNAYLEKDFELAQEKAGIASKLEKDILDSKDKFAQRQLTQANAKASADDKIVDNARQALNTILTNFGGVGLDSLPESARAQLGQLAAQAKVPRELLESSFKTLRERNMQATQDQREIQNQMRLATLAISQANLALAQDRNRRATNLSESQAKALGLPASLVGTSEDEIYADLRRPFPPRWFIDLEAGKNEGVPPNSPQLENSWESLRNSILKSDSSLDFGSLSLPAPVE